MPREPDLELERLKTQANSTTNEDLVRQAKRLARELSVIWQESRGRGATADFRLFIEVDSARADITAEGYLVKKIQTGD